MRRPGAVIAALVLAAAPGLADTDTGAALSDLPDLLDLSDLPIIPVADYAAIHHGANVLTVEMRADSAIGAAMFEFPRRPATIETVPPDCVAVLVTDATTSAADAAQTAARLRAAGCRVARLDGAARDWVAAGFAAPSRPRKPLRPGDVPFVIPRGLCESNPPAQVFDWNSD